MTMPLTEQSASTILIIEDSPEDLEILKWAFSELNLDMQLVHHQTVADAQIHLDRCEDGYFPRLILLDLNLPGTNGKHLIPYLQKKPQLRSIPVVVLTTSSNPKDIQYCYEHHANSYIIKPVDLDTFLDIIKATIHYWFNVVTLEGDADQLYANC